MVLRRRGYALRGALKLVGDRYQLSERQRTALKRATSEAATVAARLAARVPSGAAPPADLWVDGFNVLITCETALRGGVLVSTVDGGLRDLSGIHGTYRTSAVTTEALERIAATLEERGWGAVPTRWLLDAPVSNSGRLAARIRELAEADARPWRVDVVRDPDPVLQQAPPGVVVASGDAPVIDRCAAWIDLGAEAARGCAAAWIVDLGVATAS